MHFLCKCMNCTTTMFMQGRLKPVKEDGLKKWLFLGALFRWVLSPCLPETITILVCHPTDKQPLCHPPDPHHNSGLPQELWLAQLPPCHPAPLSPRSPWHRPSHPQPCPGRGSSKQEQQRHQKAPSKGTSPEEKLVVFPSHHRCSTVILAKMLLVINSGVSLCYTTFPAVHLLCNFSLECQNFCSSALNFLQLPAALIALCHQIEDCFLPALIDFYSCNTVLMEPSVFSKAFGQPWSLNPS